MNIFTSSQYAQGATISSDIGGHQDPVNQCRQILSLDFSCYVNIFIVVCAFLAISLQNLL